MFEQQRDIKWEDRPEQIHLLVRTGFLSPEAEVEAYVTKQGAEIAHRDEMEIHEITLHRPSLAPIYGGPTLLEALWSRMDDHMEALMTGAADDDTPAAARELAWVIAIVTNAYAPSIPWVKEEAMRRWNAANAQEEALNPDEQDDAMTRPEGADQ
jgi:hypothetical protein